MRYHKIFKLSTGLILMLAFATGICQQSDLKSLPDPYPPPIEHWGNLPNGRSWGSVSAIAFDSKGNLWVFERCGANSCSKSSLDPILEFDSSGKLLTSFGGGMFVFPHGLFIDRHDNIWVTDANGMEGKGQQVMEFSPQGKVLLKLGKPGVAGTDNDTFNRPSGVAVAKNGDIFVADGHGGNSNARVVKFSKDGKFIKTWGQKGTGPGEFGELHAIGIDTEGRVLVADRGNNRIQVFDEDGKFITEWKQFGTPSGLYVDKHDTLYVARRIGPNGEPAGITIGSIKDPKPTAVIPQPEQGSESVALDAKDNLFVAANSTLPPNRSAQRQTGTKNIPLRTRFCS